MLKKLETTIFAALVAVCASPGFAAKVTFNGAEIEYTNATVSYPDGAGGDIVFKFTNTVDVGGLKLPSYAQAWVLSVGGGGAGGCGAHNTTSTGAGGGGGGGGVVEVRDVVLNGGTYEIMAGAGGATNAIGVAASGGNGQPSYVKFNGSVMPAFTAGGGGGGGGEGPGEDGASGGGGSMVGKAAQAGGSVVAEYAGQGHAGGQGAHNKSGGGGGGAGAAGNQTVASGSAGSGGSGTNSWIEVAAGADPKYYGGGGGGGTMTTVTVGAGGLGGGGAGGGGMSGTGNPAGAGEISTGGGGGGGSHKQAGAAGGSGVVIIRISEALASNPEKPMAIQEFVYTGEAIYPVKPSLALDVTGEYCATNVSEYTCKAKPKAGFEWLGGGDEEITVNWKIVPREVVKPTAIETTEYDGANRLAIVSPDEALVFSDGSVTNATNAGSYSYTVSLKSDNYVWKDAEAGHEHDTLTIEWSISPKRVTVPDVLGGLVYDGTEKVAVNLVAVDSNAYHFVDNENYAHKATDAGTNYYFCVQLNNTSEAKNYIWYDGENETYDHQYRKWEIAKASNSITSLEISGWKVSPGAVGETPTATAKWGEIEYAYAQSQDAVEAEWTPWTATSKPDTAGLWWVRARVVEGDNWLGAERMASFVLWDNPANLFSHSVEFAITNYSGSTTLENFPLLVRISQESLPGFLYENAGMNGESIAFICGDDMLDYDVDTWDVTGESLVWVKIPQLKGKSTKVTMWWGLREGQETSGSRKARVWADYWGVWHFSEEIVADDAGTTKSADATGNGYDANPRNYGTASWINEMISKDGIVGRARQITSTKRKVGPRLEIDNSEGLALGGKFTMSGWFKENGNVDVGNNRNTKILASRKATNDGGNGWILKVYNTSTTKEQDKSLHGQGANGTSVRTTVVDKDYSEVFKGRWAYFSGSYNSTTLAIAGGVNGTTRYGTSSGQVAAPTDNSQKISLGYYVGNSYASGNNTSDIYPFSGEFDEFRLCKLTRSADFQKAEYETVAKADFMKAGLVNIEGLKRNYWTTLPDVQPRQWENDGSFDLSTLQISKGALADGSAVSNYFYSSKNPDVHFTDVNLLNEGGLYHAVFVMADSEGYEPIKYEINLLVIGHEPYYGLGGSTEGRVLLMNNDKGLAGKRDKIDYQGWYDRINRSATLLDTAPTFWECFGDDALTDNEYNMKAGTNWVLWTKHCDRRLWYLDNCRHGNTFKNKDSTAAGSKPTTLVGWQNYLPWSTTSLRINFHLNQVAPAFEVGQLLMRNAIDAAVYSPCYTNGVGTIYFDAVNGWTAGVNEQGYQIVVEVATETKTGDPLSDETCGTTEEDEEGGDPYGNIKEWVPVKMYPALVDGSSVTPPAEGVYTNSLAITDGGRLDKFYRIYVPVNKQRAMFRIRRVSRYKPGSDESPDYYLILIDNIFVSYPAMSAALSPTGFWDGEKRGPQTLGWELATTVPYPHAEATNCYARAAVEYYMNAGNPSADSRSFITAAQMHYRWRYLNQSFTEWRSADLDPMNGFVSYRPIDLRSASGEAAVGDIEFWFETQLQAPYFSYADYSGLGIGLPCYNEEIPTVTNRFESSATLPSGGRDWFFRLRNGESDWEGLEVMIEGDTLLDGTYPMALIEEGMWRALVPVPTNATGVCTFKFAGHNRTAGGATMVPEETVEWGGGQVAAMNDVPSDGQLVVIADGGAALSFEIDHNANYLEFKASTKFGTWSVSRAEYQNFNHWHDAYTEPKADPVFVATYPYNGADDVAMKTLTMDTSSWDEFVNTDGAWNEPFKLANYSDPGFPKEEFFQTHRTPNNWNANFLTFVSTVFAANTTRDQQEKSGIAAKIRGTGMGSIEFTKNTRPSGIGEVKATARLGQSMSDMSAFTFHGDALRKKNYTFVVPATMSQHTAVTGTAAGDMTVGASASVVAYYRPYKGCYEFRVERLFSGATVRLSLYKWSYSGTALTSQCLCAQDISNTIMWSDRGSSNEGSNKYYAMLISVDSSASSSTKIVCGLSAIGNPSGTADDIDTTYLGGSKNYGGLVFTDNESSRLTEGSYGVGSKDCPAEFIVPFHYDTTIEKILSTGIAVQGRTTTVAGGDYFLNQTFQVMGTKLQAEGLRGTCDHDRESVSAGLWETAPGRSVCYSNSAHSIRWIGFKAPTDLEQKLQLLLQPANGGAWQKFGEVDVTGYAFKEYTFPLHLSGLWNMRLQTGPDNIDLAISGIQQTQWQAPDHEQLSYLPDDYVYTQGVVEKLSSRKVVTLQPSRGSIERPFSVRGPLLHGLGKVAFSYENADANAEIWVQMATNNVLNDLTGAQGYNQSVRSDVQEKGAWITLAKYGPNETAEYRLGASGTKTCYVGLHNQADSPVEGTFRIFVPTTVVMQAGIVATNAQQNVNYGKITITGMTVSDEPGLSDRSWKGYNVRGIGDPEDSERRMYLTDTTLHGETGSGLDFALNNSLNGVAAEDRDRARATYPSIISPTFKSDNGIKNGVGTLSFKARLWSTNGVPDTVGAGRIVVYGAANSVAEESAWHVLQTNYVTSSVFKDFTWETQRETYSAIKIEVSGAATKGTGDALVPTVDRVIIDEIVVGEKVQPSLTFEYVRPFRQNLMSLAPISDILSPDEQPLVGESWGVQTQLRLKQLTDEIDTERGFEVYFTHFPGKTPWGYGNWRDQGSAPVKLVPVGDPADLIFRSVGDTPESLVEPATQGGTVIQYQITVKYWNRVGTEFTTELEKKADWQQPDWYWPVDLNEANGGYANTKNFSAYTLLDTVSPGRAWINEVNYNDGSSDENNMPRPPVDNQFIELCVPAGVDMTGWFVRLTDLNTNQWMMAKFGTGANRIAPVKELTGNELNGFAFVVLESPETNLAGGIRDYEGNKVEVDGVWSADSMTGDAVNKGSLSFSRPFQFELVRPSGVVEHQFVIGGTNVWSDYYFGDMYEATNLLAKLDAAVPSPNRFLAVTNELSRLDDGVRRASAGVVTGAVGIAELAPGKAETWSPKLVFTPGRANFTQDGREQYIPEDWFIAPNGTNSWVTLRIVGDHLYQECGGGTNFIMKIVVPQGATTNIVYTADPWYELKALKVDGGVVAEHVARNGAEYVYPLVPTGKYCEVTAESGCDSALGEYIDLEGPYAPSVVRWLTDLSSRWPDKTADDIRVAWQAGINESDLKYAEPMTLLEMYFLDIEPFNEPNDRKAIWFRHGISGFRQNRYLHTRQYQAGTFYYTNTQIDVKLYISNAVTGSVRAPSRLQGLDYMKSDDEAATEPWRGPTFQVQAQLWNDFSLSNNTFLAFRTFVFDGNSFKPQSEPDPFTATIEILDPFTSEGSLGYGWTAWPRSTGFGMRAVCTTNAVPLSVELLKTNSVYKSTLIGQ